MKIRKVKPSDTKPLEELFLITRRETFHWESPDKFRLEDFARLTLGESVFVAEGEKGKILGFISVWVQESPAFIHHLFVDPDSQRKGVGKALIESLFPWLPLPYRLKCLAKNYKALEFYLKNKWVSQGHGESEDGLYFLLELPSLDFLHNLPCPFSNRHVIPA